MKKWIYSLCANDLSAKINNSGSPVSLLSYNISTVTQRANALSVDNPVSHSAQPVVMLLSLSRSQPKQTEEGNESEGLLNGKLYIPA